MIASPPVKPDLISDPGYGLLKDYVIRATGLAYYADKDGDFAERVLCRPGRTGVNDCTDYLALLNDPAHGEEELDHLVEQLTIGETSFYRHLELFDGLRDKVLPDLIARCQGKRRLRIWSAGCSIGAEPYSLSILLMREFANQIDGWEVSILGTDINRQFLARARRGHFKDWDFRGAPGWLIDECFTRFGGEWQILPRYKEGVNFQYHNLVRHPFPSLVHNLVAFDLVLCRNVIIYFSRDIASRIIAQFNESLLDGGWLLAGHSEPCTDLFRAFRTINVPGAVLFQKDSGWSSASTDAAPVFGAGEPRSSLDQLEPWMSAAEPTHSDPSGLAFPQGSLTPNRTKPADIDPSAMLETVRRLADAGCLEEAAARCRKLIAHHPTQPVFHFYQAMLSEQIGRHEQAEASLHTAIRLDRHFPLAHYLLAQIHQKRGRQRAARRDYESVLDLVADLDDATAISEAEGLTVAGLKELTAMQLEVLHKS